MKSNCCYDDGRLKESKKSGEGTHSRDKRSAGRGNTSADTNGAERGEGLCSPHAALRRAHSAVWYAAMLTMMRK